MTEYLTKAAHDEDPDDLEALIKAYREDVLRITGTEEDDLFVARWNSARYCYDERPENGLGVLLGFGIALSNDPEQCADVIEAYLWLSNDGHQL